MNKQQYKELLIDMLKDTPEMLTGYTEEIIYTIDGLNVYGAFEYGSRTVDHNILLFDGVEWNDVLEYGCLAVPETATYISEDNVEMFEALGYERLPLDNNHINGYNN